MEYKIVGGTMPVVICNLKENESMITEKGAMKWMTPNMEMQTFSGGIGKAFGRMFSGESMFQNIYTARKKPGIIAFGSSFPGSIRAVKITPENSIIAQKSAFLAGEAGVELSIFFQKRAVTGFFSGEGFIMQKISGNGTVFLGIDGSTIEYSLRENEQLIVDTGHLAMMDETCSIDIQSVKGAKNKIFGGEGFFNTIITGPGKVILQTMPISSLAHEIARYIPVSSS